MTLLLLAAGVAAAAAAMSVIWPRRQWLIVSIAAVVLVPLLLPGFFVATDNLGISDWDYYFSYHEVVRRIVLETGEVPQWNPYICGGTSAIGDPEFPLFTPTFLIELVVGIPLGMRGAVWFVVAVTALGMIQLARRLKLPGSAALIAAIIVSFGSVSLLEIVEGHPNVFSSMWIPWVLWAWLGAVRACEPKSLKGLFASAANKWATLTALFLSLMFYAGGIYLLMYMAFAFAFLVLVSRRRLVALVITSIAGMLALLLSAAKLIPVLAWLTQFQDQAYASSAMTLPYLHHILFGRYLHGAGEIIPGQGGGWHEYGAYIGVTSIVGLAAALLLWKKRLVCILLLAAGIALLVSSLGPQLKPFFDQAPWLPRSNVSRVILMAVIPLALLAGMGVAAVLRRTRRRGGRRAVILIATVASVAIIIDIGSLASALSYQAFTVPRQIEEGPKQAPKPIGYTIDRHVVRIDGVDQSRGYLSIVQGWGTQSYCSVLSPPVSVATKQHSEEDQGQESAAGLAFVSNDAGVAKLISWHPRRIVLEVALTQTADVTLNANYAKGWTVNSEPAKNIGGRVGINLRPGEHHLDFEYRAPGFTTGAAITLLTLTALIAATFYRHRRTK